MPPLFIAALLALSGPEPAPTTTLVTHGYQPDGVKSIWVQTMAEAVRARAGGTGAILRYEQSSGDWVLVAGAPDPAEPVVLIARWVEDFEKVGPDHRFAEGAADALTASLRAPRFVDGGGSIAAFPLLEGRTVHLIGHSRGAVVNSEIARRLGHADIAIDQLTSLDPHPVDGTLDFPLNFDWGDPTPRKWTNVTFADTFWRADGGFFNAADFDGIPLADNLNLELDEGALNCCAYSFAHSDVHLWYHGTIDLGPGAADGEEAITQTMRDTWWPNAGADSGYLYSVLGGGADLRPPDQPAGEPPGAVASIFGGDFPQNSFTGWQYHGGSVLGTILTVDGRTAVRLGPAAGDQATHNRLVVEARFRAVRLLLQVFDAGQPDEQLVVELLDRDGVTWSVGEVALADAPAGWHEVNLAVDDSLPRPEIYRLQVRRSAPAGPSSVVALDGLELREVMPGDVNGDGVVDVLDLVALIVAWGACPEPPMICPADLDDDGMVGVNDLIMLILAWG